MQVEAIGSYRSLVAVFAALLISGANSAPPLPERNTLTCIFLSGWGDLNSRPLDPQSSALTKLRHSPYWQRC